MTSTCAEANRRAPRDISAGEVGVLRCKGASLEHCFSVESSPGVLRGGHFDDSTKFSSVFGRIVCGKDFHRLKLFDLDSGGENRRTIIDDGDAVDDVLCVIFGSARMQNAVGFQQPTRLHIHQFQDCTAG